MRENRYVIVFWAIVLVYQYAALDFLLKWQITRSAAKRIQGVLAEIRERFG